MRIDLYTKTLLTLIVLLLAVIAYKPLVHPVPAKAQTSYEFTGVQFSADGSNGFWLFSYTGNVWHYRINGPTEHYWMNAPGNALSKK
jgi:hypothetical protein